MLREPVTSGVNEDATLQLQTGSAPKIGDLLVLFHLNDHYNLSNLQTPGGGGSGGWTLVETADDGTNGCHGKVWISEVTSDGTQTVELRQGENPGGGGGNDNACQFGWLAVIVKDATVEDSSSDGGPGDEHPAPSVTFTSDSGILLCGWVCDGGVTDYTLPGSMSAEDEIDCGIFATSAFGVEQITSSGATGTRTATLSQARDGIAVSVAVSSTLTEIQGTGTASLNVDSTATGRVAIAGTATADLDIDATSTGVILGTVDGAATADLAFSATAEGLSGVVVGSGLAGLGFSAAALAEIDGTGLAAVEVVSTARGFGEPGQPRFLLRNPTYDEGLWTANRLFIRYTLPRGITLAVTGSQVEEITYPYQGDLDSYDKVYMGGYDHRLTRVEANVLIAAGYEEFLTPLED